jgi:broad specificity polyphosphatase/5'/3'-nucleotidase SurE
LRTNSSIQGSNGVSTREGGRTSGYNGPLVEDAEEGTDVHAIRKGNVSITPITLDCTAKTANDDLRRLFR